MRNLDSGTYICTAQNTLGRAHAAAMLVVDAQDAHQLAAENHTSLLSHLQKRKEEMKKDISVFCNEESAASDKITDSLSSLSREHDVRSSVLAKLPKGVFTRTCTVTEGKHAKLSCFVTGHPKPHIIWRKDGANISEGRRHVMYEDQAENFLLKILYCKQDDNGFYTCNATNMAGQTYSAVLVTVKGKWLLIIHGLNTGFTVSLGFKKSRLQSLLIRAITSNESFFEATSQQGEISL